jgi:phosphohistidine phosphatase SixA
MTKRQLIILRHAKSSWKSGASHDHERPLNERGKRDAPNIGAVLATQGWEPQLVICSDAARTMQTWQLMRGAFSNEVLERYAPRFYHASMGAVRQVLSDVEADIQRVMVIGHNPGWEQVVDWLTDCSVRMTTCNAVLLNGAGPSWEDALSEPGSWSIEAVIRPKEL